MVCSALHPISMAFCVCVFVWISSSHHGQDRVLASLSPVSARFPTNLWDFLFTSNFPVQLMEQVPPSYLLPFTIDLALFYRAK